MCSIEWTLRAASHPGVGNGKHVSKCSITAKMEKQSAIAHLETGAFGDAITSDGRIDAKSLAGLLDLPLATIAPALGLTPRALGLNPASPRVQSNAARLLTAMNELALSLTERRYAIFWLKTPCDAFGGDTPADWLKAGDLSGVCTHINRVVLRQPD